MLASIENLLKMKRALRKERPFHFGGWENSKIEPVGPFAKNSHAAPGVRASGRGIFGAAPLMPRI